MEEPTISECFPRVLSSEEHTQLIERVMQDLNKEDSSKGETVRIICKDEFHYNIPTELRGTIYQILLGIPGQEDAELDAGQVQLQIHNDCSDATSFAFLKDVGDKERKFMSDGLERILAFHAKKIAYRHELLPICAPFLLMKIPNERVIYNCFSSFWTKFVPETLAFDKIMECTNYLFRLGLQYHLPKLCLHIGSRQASIEAALLSWFSTLFTSICDDSISLFTLWDYLLLEGDSAGYLFLGLAVVDTLQDVIMALNEPLEISTALQSFRITSREDAMNLCKLAKAFKLHTPSSFQQMAISCALRVKDFDQTSYENLKKSICLTVSAPEVLQHQITNTKIGPLSCCIVDCRPTEQYSNGRLPNSKHLNSKVLEESPEEFAQLIEGFKAVGEMHFAFFGTGDLAEDLGLNLIISRFLQARFKYISLLAGGYKSCHHMFSKDDMTELLVDHESDKCLVCQQQKGETFLNSSKAAIGAKLSSLSGMLKTKSPSMKDIKLPRWPSLGSLKKEPTTPTKDPETPKAENEKDVPESPKSSILGSSPLKLSASSLLSSSPKLFSSLLGSKEKDKQEKQVNITEKEESDLVVPMFTIDDEDEETPLRRKGSKGPQDHPEDSKVQESIDKWKVNDNLIFKANLMHDNTQSIGFLVITNELVIWLQSKDTQGSVVAQMSEENLSTLDKITYKKSTPNVLSFQYKEKSVQYSVEQPADIVSAVNIRVAEL